jgi:hypothetical protein
VRNRCVPESNVFFYRRYSEDGNMACVLDSNMRWVKRLLAGAYTLAMVPSVMQFFVRDTVEPDPLSAPGWMQCTTVWRVAYYRGDVGDAVAHSYTSV